jgi:hypothetical protein
LALDDRIRGHLLTMPRRRGPRRQGPKPHWEGETGELLYGGAVVKTVSRGKATRVVPVLEAFERAGWPHRISDPAGLGEECLHSTIKSLNENFRIIRFHADGTGLGIAWALSG